MTNNRLPLEISEYNPLQVLDNNGFPVCLCESEEDAEFIVKLAYDYWDGEE